MKASFTSQLATYIEKHFGTGQDFSNKDLHNFADQLGVAHKSVSASTGLLEKRGTLRLVKKMPGRIQGGGEYAIYRFVRQVELKPTHIPPIPKMYASQFAASKMMQDILFGSIRS